MFAVIDDCWELLQILLAAKLIIIFVHKLLSQDGDTALMIAIKFNQLDSAVVLMDAGVDLNIKNKV